MNPQQAENLRILIRHMETKCARPLMMGSVHHCGTPACAIGEAAVLGIAGMSLDRLDYSGACVSIGGRVRAYDVAADTAFGTVTPFKATFAGAKRETGYEVGPKFWAAEARKVLAEHGYSMDTDDAWADRKVAALVTEFDGVKLHAPAP